MQLSASLCGKSRPAAGDGAGILVSIPQEFIIRVTSELGIDLPPRNYYGVGMCFLPTEAQLRDKVKALMNEVRRHQQFRVPLERVLHLRAAKVCPAVMCSSV